MYVRPVEVLRLFHQVTLQFPALNSLFKQLLVVLCGTRPDWLVDRDDAVEHTGRLDQYTDLKRIAADVIKCYCC
jgi:hypothetical protein